MSTNETEASIECPTGMRWCKHSLPKQQLLSAIPHVYKCLDAPVFATEQIGSPLTLQRIHATFRPRPTGDFQSGGSFCYLIYL